MKQFIALTLLMGIIKKPEISNYWSTHPLLKSSIFNTVMPRNRYQSILQFLHFADNSLYNANDPNRDKLYKVRPVIDYLVNKFKSVYMPEQNISINEELLLWKGKLAFKQYIPLKRSRFGIKLFSLCENSGYLWNSSVYLGKEVYNEDRNIPQRLGKSVTIVIQLLDSLMNKGYHLYVDNWYTGQELFNFLRANNTLACGTARKNRVRLPNEMIKAPLQKGQHLFRRCGDLLAVRLQDKKEVFFLSTIHKANIVNIGKGDFHGNEISKLQVVHDYNKYMGGVDKNDEILANYKTVRKTMKWTKKVAFHFIEEAIFNALILWKKNGNHERFLKFKLGFITELLAMGGAHIDEIVGANNRLSGRHFPEIIAKTPKKTNPQKRCIDCTSSGIRKESRYQCANCNNKPGLCVAPCFQIYHTQASY
jgi:hypothetical protein